MGSLVMNDPVGGGSLPEGHEVRRRAGELTIDDEIGPIDRRSLNAPTSVGSNLVKFGFPETDDNERAPTEAGLDKVTGPKKTGTIINGPVPSNSRKRRAAPTHKATRKSETAITSHDHRSEEDDKSNRGSLMSKQVAVTEAAKRKRKKRRLGSIT